MAVAANFAYFAGAVAGALDLTQAICTKYKLNRIIIRALTLESDADLTLQAWPGFTNNDKVEVPNESRLFGSAPYRLHLAGSSEGLGTNGADKIVLVGNGIAKVSVWFDIR